MKRRAAEASGADDGRARDAELAARLRRFDTPTLSDALERIHQPSAALGIRRLSPGAETLVGRALTVELGPVGTTRPATHLGARAIDAAEGGEVIVVANRGRLDVAAWGGLLSAAAEARGVAGVVVDGACRDVGDLRSLDLQVFARAAVPLTARGRIAELGFGEPVAIAGVRVSPGDWILADDSGVVVVPAARVDDALDAAADLARGERQLVAALVAGRSAAAVLGTDYEEMLGDAG